MARIYKVKMVLLNYFDPCKSVLSVLSVVRFGFPLPISVISENQW